MHSQEATQNGVSIKATDGGFPPWGALLGENCGQATLFQPQPSPRADDTQGSRGPSSTETRHPPLPEGLNADPALCQGDTVCCQPTLAGMEPQEMLPAGHSTLRCLQSRQAARDTGDLAANLCNGCFGLVYPVHPALRAASSP